MKRIIEIETAIIPDDDPDLSYLETEFEEITNDDEEVVGITILDSARYNEDTIKEYGWKKVLQWITEDRERLESHGQTWWCVGLRREAKIEITQPGEGHIIRHIKIESSGLWGIESDAGEEYFQEVAQQEDLDLRALLSELGFSELELKRAFEPEIVEVPSWVLEYAAESLESLIQSEQKFPTTEKRGSEELENYLRERQEELDEVYRLMGVD